MTRPNLGLALAYMLGAPLACSETSNHVPNEHATEASATDVAATEASNGASDAGPPGRLAVRIALASCGVDGEFTMPNDDERVLGLLGGITQAKLDQLPRLVNGEDGALVACSVTETADNQFSFSASARTAYWSFGLGYGAAPGPSSSGSGLGHADVWFLSPHTIPARSGNMCQVEAVQVLEGGGGLLLEFTCSPPNSTFESVAIDTPNCAATGTVVFDRCSWE